MALHLIDVASKPWDVHQRQGGDDEPVKFRVDMNLAISGTEPYIATLSGTADGGTPDLTGSIRDGVVTDRTVAFNIAWSNGKVGDYRGFIYDDGYLRGVTRNAHNPSESAEWWSFQNSFKVRQF